MLAVFLTKGQLSPLLAPKMSGQFWCRAMTPRGITPVLDSLPNAAPQDRVSFQL